MFIDALPGWPLFRNLFLYFCVNICLYTCVETSADLAALSEYYTDAGPECQDWTGVKWCTKRSLVTLGEFKTAIKNREISFSVYFQKLPIHFHKPSFPSLYFFNVRRTQSRGLLCLTARLSSLRWPSCWGPPLCTGTGRCLLGFAEGGRFQAGTEFPEEEKEKTKEAVWVSLLTGLANLAWYKTGGCAAPSSDPY